MAAAKQSSGSGVVDLTRDTNQVVQADKSGDITVYQDYGDMGVMGMEDAPLPALPFFKILSDRTKGWAVHGSPIYNKEAGLIYYTGDDSLHQRMDMQVCYMQCVWQRWASKKDTNDAPMASYPSKPKDAVWNTEGGNMLPDGTWVHETHFWYVLGRVTGHAPMPGVIAMSKTFLKASRQLNKEIHKGAPGPAIGQRSKAPAFATLYGVTTLPETNGINSWRAWQFTPTGKWLSRKNPEFAEAFRFYEEAKKYVSEQDLSDPKATVNQTTDDEIPF